MATAFRKKIQQLCKAIDSNKKELAILLGISPSLLNSWMIADPPNNQNFKLILAELISMNAIVTLEQAEELLNVAYPSDSVTYKFSEDEQKEDWYKELLAKTSGDVEYHLKYVNSNATTKKKLFSLPKPISTVIGREREITQLKELLLLPDVRLLTIKAAGGTGKTSVGLQTLNELHEELDTNPPLINTFADGILFTKLTDATSTSLMISSLLQNLELKPPASGSDATPGQVLLNYLANKNMLIMLDNFEQLIATPDNTFSGGDFKLRDAGERTGVINNGVSGDLALKENPKLFLHQLLNTAPGMKLMVTSRERLRIHGEQVIELKPLAIPPLTITNSLEIVNELDITKLIREYPGVALFAKLAKQNDGDFKLTSHNIRDVCAICAYVGGLPLAIEIAAARINEYTPAQMLHAIQPTPQIVTNSTNASVLANEGHPNGLIELLDMGTLGLPERHHSLKNTLDWSYSLLNELEQIFFRRLFIFEGGFNLAAISEVCQFGVELEQVPKEKITRLVSSLVDKSLIHPSVPDPISSIANITNEPRYEMLILNQSYAKYLFSKMATAGAKELAELQDRYADYFLALARQAEPHLIAASREIWQDKLSTDYINLAKTLWWLVGKNKINEATELVSILGYIWHSFGTKSTYLNEGRNWLNQILFQGNENNRAVLPENRAKALHQAGRLASLNKDKLHAKALFTEALGLWRKLKNQKGLAASLISLGNIYYAEENHQKAAELYSEAEILARKLNDKHALSNCTQNLANIALTAQDLTKAKLQYHEALKLKRELGNPASMAIIFKNLATIAIKERSLEEAEEFSLESLELNQQLANHSNKIENFLNLGRVAYLKGSSLRCKEYYRKGLTLILELSNFHCLPFAAIHVAQLLSTSEETLSSAAIVCGAVEDWVKTPKNRIDLEDRNIYNSTVSMLKQALDKVNLEKSWHEGLLIASDMPQLAKSTLALLS